MNPEEPITEPSTEEPVTDPPTEEPVTEPPTEEPGVSSSLFIEKIDPIIEDTNNLEVHTKAILDIMKQNELEEQQAKEAEAIAAAEAEEAQAIAEAEAGEIIDYQKLAYEELVKQTAILEEHGVSLTDGNTMVAEQSIMLTIALVVVVGVKVFIDQITKW